MKRIKTTDITTGVAYPLTKKGFDFLQDSYKETIASLTKALLPSYAANTPYVLYGMVKTSLGGSNYAYTAGSVFYNGEVYDFDAIATIAIATSDVCTITVTNDGTADPIEFTDGSTKNVHNVRKVTLANAASVTNGATQFNYSSCVFLIDTKKDADDYASAGSLVEWGDYAIKFWKDGMRNRVYIQGSVEYNIAVAPGLEKEIFVLPTGYRPTSAIATIEASGGGGVENYRLSISTGGSVSVVDESSVTTTNQIFYINLSFEII